MGTYRLLHLWFLKLNYGRFVLCEGFNSHLVLQPSTVSYSTVRANGLPPSLSFSQRLNPRSPTAANMPSLGFVLYTFKQLPFAAATLDNTEQTVQYFFFEREGVVAAKMSLDPFQQSRRNPLPLCSDSSSGSE